MANKQIKDYSAVVVPAGGDFLLTQQSDDINRKLTVAQAVGAADPKTHAVRHISGGVDTFTSAQLLEALIKRIRESGGADLLVGAVADTELLQRSATNIVGLAKATQAEAEAGTDNTKWVTALRVAQAGLGAGLTGLALANNGADATNDIDVAVGGAFSNDAVLANRRVMILVSALTKQLDVAWAVGNNAGMRDTGAISDAWWHIFLIKRTDTGVVDVLASLSFSAPTMPTSYDKKKWIGAIFRTAGAIKAFSQYQDEFLWKGSILDVDATNPGTAAVLRTLTVPTGLKVWPIMRVSLDAGTSGLGSTCLISSPDVNDEAPSLAATPLGEVAPISTSHVDLSPLLPVRSDTSAQVRTRLNLSGAADRLRMATLGWKVDRAEVI